MNNRLIRYILLIILYFILTGIAYSQNQYTVMSYNLLNYPGNDTITRNPYFRTVIGSVLPDILVCQEITSQAGVNGFLSYVLLPYYTGYASGTFINGPDTDSGIFYKSDHFTFVSNTAITTDLRNIYEFKLFENSSGDTLIIYSVHLKASTGTSNEQQRLAEVNVLRSITDALEPGSFFMVLGDFNIYGSFEPAYSALLDQTNPGYFIDLFDLSGTWNDAAYASFHTQSTRTRQFGGGATGGLDDRFDMILLSQQIINEGGIQYVDGSYIPYGNDGNHYNDSINRPPNLAVGQTIANALHYSSDHLPVLADFQFDQVSAQTFQLSVDISNGWNFVSVPGINPDGMGISDWWADLTGNVYTFISGSGYASVINTVPTKAYWMKNTISETYTYPAIQAILNDPINVYGNWNTIGGYEDTIDVMALTTIPPGQIIYPIYKYVPGSGYQIATQIVPGYGYWIKMASGCQIIFPADRAEFSSAEK